MTPYEAATRIARVLYTLGPSSLSDSEISVLHSDPKLRGLVDALVDKFRRTDLLENETPGVRDRPASLFPPDTKAGDHVDWTTPTTMRRAELWLSPRHGRAVLEIKEWSLDAYAGAHDAGAHRTILQQRMATASGDELLEEVRRHLRRNGCPDDKVQTFGA